MESSPAPSMQPHTTAASFATSASESSSSLNTMLTFPPTSNHHPLHNPNPTNSIIVKRSLSEARLDGNHLSDPMQEDNITTSDDVDVSMAVSQCKRLKLQDGGIRKVSVQVSIPMVSNVSLLHHHGSLKRPHSFMSGEATAGTASVWEDSYSVFSSGKDTAATGTTTSYYPLSSLSMLPHAHASSLDGDSNAPLNEVDGIPMDSSDVNHCNEDSRNVAYPTMEHPPESTTETATNDPRPMMMPMNTYLGTLHLEREERSSRKRIQQQHQDIVNDIPPYYTSSQNSMSSVSQFMASSHQDMDDANHYASSASLSSSSFSSGNATDEGVIWTPLEHRNNERRTHRNNGTRRQYYQSQLPSDSNLY